MANERCICGHRATDHSGDGMGDKTGCYEGHNEAPSGVCPCTRFRTVHTEPYGKVRHELTKREYFAAQSLAIWQMEEFDTERLENGETPNHKMVAKFCVELADALIEALNK